MTQHDQTLRYLTANLSTVTERLDNTTANLFQQGQAYNNAVITIGYAGFFGIWAFTKEYLPENAVIQIAIAMGASILLFVLYTVANTLYITFAIVKANSKLRHVYTATTLEGLIKQSDEHKKKAVAFEKEIHRSALGMLIAWPFFFLPSLFAALWAAFLLFYNFLAHQISWLNYWPQ